ncbi:MAG: hypothetical protein H7836_15365 [Magnetococcus sp. YQC-3]
MKAILLGVVKGTGVSQKGKGTAYDFAQIRILRQAKGFENDNAKFSAFGYKEATASCSKEFYAIAEKVKVDPLQLREYEFIVDNQFNEFDKLEAVIVGMK